MTGIMMALGYALLLLVCIMYKYGWFFLCFFIVLSVYHVFGHFIDKYLIGVKKNG